MQKVPSEVLSLANSIGFDTVTYVREWKGTSVYEAWHNDDTIYCVGYPAYIRFADGVASWFDRAETISILKELA